MVNIDDAPRCEQCAVPLTGQAVGGLCANCLLKLALDPPGRLTATSSESADEPAEAAAAPGETAGLLIGHYRLLQQIGQGGFGTVWMAEQNEPVQRRVALKIVRIGMDTREFIARFEQERQALAMMDHPNIAKVFDAGATENGRPFFVMELVPGVPITRFCDEQKLPLPARLELFIEVCRAIQHAHQKGIIHRDIKPSNVMVALDGDKPVPKIIDFGIAKATQGKLTDETIFTHFEQFIGTPVYMSPEQAGMVPDIDTRSDIYALGVLLYELLTGKPPFDAKSLVSAGYEEMRRIIREVEPPKPSTRRTQLLAASTAGKDSAKSAILNLQSRIDPDLDWIVMKAIDKDRARRYETVSGLALDLQRFLANEPVSATPPSAAYKFRKFARRNKTALSMGAATAAALIAATIVSSWQAVRATNAEKLATEAGDLAKRRLVEVAAERDQKDQARKDAEEISTFLGEVFQSPDPSRDGRTIKVADLLDKAVRKLDTDLAAQPGHRARLQAALGATYSALGLAREAIPLQEKTRDYYHAASGPEHPDMLAAMGDLATSYHDAGRRDESLELREQVLSLRHKVYGPEHPGTLLAMHYLAISYHDAGRRDEALKLREAGLTLSRKVNGPEHLTTLAAMNDLANSFGDAGRRAEALTLREAVLALRHRVNGPEDPETLNTKHNLAVSYQDAGRRDEALQLLEEVLTLRRKVLGPEHPDTLIAMQSLAISYFDAGRRDESLELREQVLACFRNVLRLEHPYTLQAMHNLASSYDAAGKRDEALKLREEGVGLSRRVNGPEHSDTLAAMSNLANSYQGAGHNDEALKLREEVLPLSRRMSGPEHPDTLAAMTNLADSYGGAGRLVEAIELQEQSLAIKRRVLVPDHPHLAVALRNMADLYEKDGRKDEGLKLRDEMETLRRASFPAIRATLVAPDAQWKWLHPIDGNDPASQLPGFHTAFFLPDFDDSTWRTGNDSDDPARGFGYAKTFAGVDIGKPENEAHRHTAYFRHRFETGREHTSLELRCRADDGIIVYLDGKEVIRYNTEAGADAYLLHSKKTMPPENDIVVHRRPIPGVLAAGTHTLAISVHNTAPPSTDLRLGGVTLVEVQPCAKEK